MRVSLAIGKLACLGAFLMGCRQVPEARPRPRSAPLLRESAEDIETLTPGQAADLQIALGRSLERRGEFDRAIAAYLEALERDEGRADACLRLAVLHDRRGRFQDSAAYYQRALEARPGDADAYCDMGYSLYLQRRYAEAEMNLRQALALDPDHPHSHNNLGLLLAHENRLDEALVEFRRGGCSTSAAHENLAFVLTLGRQWPEARDHYRLALAADPASEVAQTRLRELETLVAQEAPTSPISDLDNAATPASATIPRSP